MNYNIWCEGFVATGQRGKATLLGTIEANSFREACDLMAVKDSDFAKYYDSSRLTYWGCRLYDNINDASKFAG